MGLFSWLGFDGACEEEPIELNDGNFHQEVMRSETPVVVDFWSNGCAPCNALVPTIRKLTCKYKGQIKVAQLNVADGMKTASKLGVRGTPTILFFKNGSVVERVVGTRGQHYYEEIIENDLLEKAPETEVEPDAKRA